MGCTCESMRALKALWIGSDWVTITIDSTDSLVVFVNPLVEEKTYTYIHISLSVHHLISYIMHFMIWCHDVIDEINFGEW